jgi:hypothetical protein
MVAERNIYYEYFDSVEIAEALPCTEWLASWYNPAAVCEGFEIGKMTLQYGSTLWIS